MRWGGGGYPQNAGVLVECAINGSCLPWKNISTSLAISVPCEMIENASIFCLLKIQHIKGYNYYYGLLWWEQEFDKNTVWSLMLVSNYRYVNMMVHWHVHTVRLEQNGCWFVDDIILCIFCIRYMYFCPNFTEIVPKGPINTKLFEVMALWCADNKSFLDTVMTHFIHPCICITASMCSLTKDCSAH